MQTLVFNQETKTIVLYSGSYRREDSVVIRIDKINSIRFNGISALCIDNSGTYKLIVPLTNTNIIYT